MVGVTLLMQFELGCDLFFLSNKLFLSLGEQISEPISFIFINIVEIRSFWVLKASENLILLGRSLKKGV